MKTITEQEKQTFIKKYAEHKDVYKYRERFAKVTSGIFIGLITAWTIPSVIITGPVMFALLGVNILPATYYLLCHQDDNNYLSRNCLGKTVSNKQLKELINDAEQQLALENTAAKENTVSTETVAMLTKDAYKNIQSKFSTKTKIDGQNFKQTQKQANEIKKAESVKASENNEMTL